MATELPDSAPIAIVIVVRWTVLVDGLGYYYSMLLVQFSWGKVAQFLLTLTCATPAQAQVTLIFGIFSIQATVLRVVPV